MKEGPLLPTLQGAHSHPDQQGSTGPGGLAGQWHTRRHMEDRQPTRGPGALTPHQPGLVLLLLCLRWSLAQNTKFSRPGCRRLGQLPRLKLGEGAPGAGVSDAWERRGGREAGSRGQQELRSPRPSSSIPRDPDRPKRRRPEASGGGQPAGGAGLGGWPDGALVDDRGHGSQPLAAWTQPCSSVPGSATRDPTPDRQSQAWVLRT